MRAVVYDPKELSMQLATNSPSIHVDIRKDQTVFRTQTEEFTVPTPLLASLGGQVGDTRLVVKGRFLKSFVTLVKESIHPGGPSVQKLDVPKQLLQETSRCAGNISGSMERIAAEQLGHVNKYAELLSEMLHHPSSALHDVHTAEGSLWAMRQKGSIGCVKLDIKTGQLEMQLATDEEQEMSIRSAAFQENIQYQPGATRLRVTSAEMVSPETLPEGALRELAEELQSKRRRAMQPLTTPKMLEEMGY
jgi:hypothetical protein